MTPCPYSCGKRAWRTALLLVVIVAVSACSGGNSDGHAPSPRVDLALPDLTQQTVDVTAPLVIDPPRANTAATSPAEAVRRFVRAELDRDRDASYDLLSANDRTTVRGIAGWKAVHSSLPVLVAFTASNTQLPPSADEATIAGDATYEPRLDELGGLVATRSRVTWTTVPEDGGWRISYQRTRLEPQYPSDAGATAAANAWLAAAQRCTPDPTLEYGGGIVGQVGVFAALCKAAPSQLDAPKRLSDRPDPAPVLAAFGPEADTWARVVHVRGTRSFNLVLAPLDSKWIVIGVLADGP